MISHRDLHGFNGMRFFITPGYTLDEMDPLYGNRIDQCRECVSHYFKQPPHKRDVRCIPYDPEARRNEE
ncbi:hypothetical protein GF342_05285 [Candidatus Woesearchaeota archaeon]|nr:hypothetical protein [Candidatus Woesearchaeota archaeon]